jgi:hypothetical protein
MQGIRKKPIHFKMAIIIIIITDAQIVKITVSLLIVLVVVVVVVTFSVTRRQVNRCLDAAFSFTHTAAASDL